MRAGGDGEGQARLDFTGVRVFDQIFDVAAISAEAWSTFLRESEELFVSMSFFVKASEQARCMHEALAKQIFELHTRTLVPGRDFDPDRSGIEWWIQMRDAAAPGGYEVIGFHWDKDEDLVDEQGLNVHPLVATITYLTASGPPTIVLSHRTGVEYGTERFGAIDEAVVCYPLPGKHVAFDGRLLHGVPSDLAVDDHVADVPEFFAAKRDGPAGRRLTLLANVWLDYVPLNVQALPAAAIAELGLTPVIASEAPDAPTSERASASPPAIRLRPAGAELERAAAPLSLDRCAPHTELLYGMGPTGNEYQLTLRLPVQVIVAARRAGRAHSFRLVGEPVASMTDMRRAQRKKVAPAAKPKLKRKRSLPVADQPVSKRR